MNWATSASLASSPAVTSTSLPPRTGKEPVRSGEGAEPLTMVARAVPGHITTGTENAQAFTSDFGNSFNTKPAWQRDVPPHKTQEAETNPSESTSYPMVRNPPRPPDNWGQRVNKAYNRSEEKQVYRTSKIPDPGVKIVGAYPYDTRAPWYKGREATSLREIKRELSADSTPPVPPPKDQRAQSQSVHIVPPSNGIWENEREVEEHPYETRQYGRHNRTVEADETRNNRVTSYRGTRMSTFHSPEGSGNRIGQRNNSLAPPNAPARMFSMPRLTPSHYNKPGVLKANKYHQQTMKDRLSRIIDEQLQHQMAYPDGFKPNLKLDSNAVTKYDGSSKFLNLENWVSAVTYRYALQRLGGDHTVID